MPDISMCMDATCPARSQCLRYTVIPSGIQSYGGYSYSVKHGCEAFAPITLADRTRTVEEADLAVQLFKEAQS